MLTSDLTKVSVGICAYNEEKNIGVLLENLLTKQGLACDSEIIIVCSGCTDHTSQVVEQFACKDKRINLIIEQERKGKVSALNIILKLYKGDFLFLVPADVVPAPFSLDKLLTEMRLNPDVGVSCGRPVPVNEEDDFIGYMGHLIWRLHHRTLKSLHGPQLGGHASGELMVVRRDIVEKIPPSAVNDDAYIAVLAAKRNFIAAYRQDAIVYIKAPTSIVDFIKQRRRVVFGHRGVKRITKQSPRTLEGMISHNPEKTLAILREEIKERPKDSLRLFAVVLIEVIVNLLAFVDSLRKKEHSVWAIAESTKELS